MGCPAVIVGSAPGTEATPDWNELERLAALRRFDILDTQAEPAFDDAVALVKAICRVPIALVSLVDQGRQWFKAKVGVTATETGLDTSVCALAIRQPGVFVVEDLASDPRTATMSLVTGDPRIRFYAGAPLVTSDGLPLGSLCAIDTAPRPGGLTPEQEAALTALARQVVAHIEMRGAITLRERALMEQEKRQQQATRDAAVLHAILGAQQQVLGSGGDLEQMLDALVEAVRQAIAPADDVAIELRDGADVVCHAVSETSRDRIGRRSAIGSSLAGACLASQTILIVADTHNDTRIDRDRAARLDARSLLIVPLIRQGGTFGVLKLRARVADAFAARDIRLAQMLAGLVAASFTEIAETAALRAAEETEQGYRQIVDSAIDSAIISIDGGGRITSWSKGAETIMGWSEGEVLGQPLALIFTAEDVASDRPGQEMATALRTGRAADERWHMRKDGGRFFASGAITPLLGARSGFVKSLRDVTEDHATRSALDESRRQLDTALDTGLIGFFTLDVARRIIRGDARFAEFHDLPAADAAAGISLDAIAQRIFPADLPAFREKAGDTDAPTDFSRSYRVMGAGGRERWMLLRARCIGCDEGQPIDYVGTAIDVTLQRAAEERLEINRERLELATRAAQLGSFDFLPQTGLLDWDDRCRALFGLPPGAPVSYEDTFLAGLHPEDRTRADSAVAASLDPAGGGTFDVEYRTVGIEDGITRVIAAKGLALFADDVAVRLIGTVQDVTADRTARATLAETEERLRLAGRATNDAIWDWDLRRDHVLWNDALHGAYGHALGEVEPTSHWWLDHVHPDDRARVTESIHAAIGGRDTDWSDDYRFRRADGSYADVRDRGYVIRDEHGVAIRMLGALLDQSDRKAVERDLQALNQSLETSVTARTRELDQLWETSPDLLVVLDFTGFIQRVNPAWAIILGYRPDELLGRRIDEFVLPEDVTAMAQALAEGTAGPMPTVETRCHAGDGTIEWISWVAAPMDRHIYATGRHITAQKKAQAALRNAEEQLRQSQKVEAIGQLTGGVAHDFNNLLTVIRGSADLLRKPDLPEDRRKRYIDAIADTADRATKLTSQLLAFARRSSLKPETFDAGRAIMALRDMMGTLTGSMIEVRIDVPDDPCFIDADVSQFDTAIVNMAVNARDAMDRKGMLAIAVRPADAIPAMRNHPRVAGDFVAVSISDTGAGIADDKIEHIFEPFFTTKEVGEGTGLGLSQVFGFAKQSGGEILVESVFGAGTVFTLFLPRAAARREERRVPDRDRIAPDRGACILVVEDNQDVGAFATSALAELGHATVLAGNAEQALARLAEDATAFDAVFSDVVMPGISGIELAQEINRRHPDLPVLLTSGYSNVLAQEGTHGFDLLHKPYSMAELSAALRRVTGADATGD